MPYMQKCFYREKKAIALLKTSALQEKFPRPILVAKRIAAQAPFAYALKQLNQPVTALVALSESDRALCDGKILAHLARQLPEQLAAEC